MALLAIIDCFHFINLRNFNVHCYAHFYYPHLCYLMLMLSSCLPLCFIGIYYMFCINFFKNKNALTFFLSVSLFRLGDQEDAQIRFMVLREVLPVLVKHMPHEFSTQQGLQTVCDLVRDHQTWTVAHIAAYFGYAGLFHQPEVARYFICCFSF